MTHAQGGGSLINLDRLQIISLGASVGRVFPSQVEPANVYSTQAEYGPIGQKWHLSFSVSYWESRYRDDVVRTFVDSLDKSLTDTSARIEASRIDVFDVTFGGFTLATNPPRLQRAANEAFIVIEFPPQSFGEEAYLESQGQKIEPAPKESPPPKKDDEQAEV